MTRQDFSKEMDAETWSQIWRLVFWPSFNQKACDAALSLVGVERDRLRERKEQFGW